MKFQLLIDTTNATYPDGTKGIDRKLEESGPEERLELAKMVSGRALDHFQIELVDVEPS